MGRALSSSSTIVTVDNTGHHIEVDQPQLVIDELAEAAPVGQSGKGPRSIRRDLPPLSSPLRPQLSPSSPYSRDRHAVTASDHSERHPSSARAIKPLALRSAGGAASATTVVEHIGRKSGRPYPRQWSPERRPTSSSLPCHTDQTPTGWRTCSPVIAAAANHPRRWRCLPRRYPEVGRPGRRRVRRTGATSAGDVPGRRSAHG